MRGQYGRPLIGQAPDDPDRVRDVRVTNGFTLGFWLFAGFGVATVVAALAATAVNEIRK